MKRGLTRTIYSNYDLWDDYAESAKENLQNNGISNPTENDISLEISELDSFVWDETKCELSNFFVGETWILQGTVQRWDGSFSAGFIFTDFDEMFFRATKDCDFWHFYDENGHLFLACSHHDGTNIYEIKKLTDKGVNYLKRWEHGYGYERSERYIHDQIMKNYTVLPHFSHIMYGLPSVEYT